MVQHTGKKDQINHFTHIYFLGIGGIGVSALARYALVRGYQVAGYDRTPSAITEALIKEEVNISFSDEVATIPEPFKDPIHTLVVYTPAVPEDNRIMQFFRGGGFQIIKRAQMLGEITRQMVALCISGTHGKTTTSTLLAHLLYQSEIGCNAFLGGISRNYGTNILLQPESNLVVVEADEFDRSFHQLTPTMAVITAADPDHLDIYGTPEAYRESFEHFTSLIKKGGVLLMKKGVPVTPRVEKTVKVYTYAVQDKADFYADNIQVGEGTIHFDFHTPTGLVLEHLKLGVPVWVNIENATAALAIAWLNGVSESELRLGIASFQGCQRRFNMLVNTPKVTLIDDYAHHPEELRASITSVQRVFPDRTFVAIFQPHLYSRTRDLLDGFVEVLSMVDNVILLPIYPAREQPIEGVSSALILERLTSPHKLLCQKEELVHTIEARIRQAGPDENLVFLTLGAGDIDRLLPDISKAITKQTK